MPRKVSPEVRLRAYPQAAMKTLTMAPVAVADVFADMMQRDAGDSTSIRADEEPRPQTWTERDGLRIPGNVRLVQFSDGQVSEGATAAAVNHSPRVAGFCLQPTLYPFNSRMVEASTAAAVPQGDPAHEVLEWEVIRGLTDAQGRSRWDTVVPVGEPRQSAIFHAQQAPNQVVIARTKEPMYADFCFQLRLSHLQIARGHKVPARIRLTWGGGAYALVFRQNQCPTVERPARNGAGSTITGSAWEVWRLLDAVGETDFESDLTIRVEQIGGRLCITVGDVQADLIASRPIYGAAQRGSKQTEEPINVSWPAGRLSIHLWGVSATLRLSALRYALKMDVPVERGGVVYPANTEICQIAEVVRVRRRLGSSVPQTQGLAVAQGHRPPGTAARVQLEAVGDQVRYVLNMNADELGYYTPFITGVAGNVRGQFNQDPFEPMDLTPALFDWEYTSSEPGVATSAEMRLTLERDVMDMLPLPSDAPPPGPTTPSPRWRHYLDALQYNPLDFSVRWHMDDGSVTPWVGLFRGYAWEVSKETPEFGTYNMTVTTRDGSIRYKEPAAVLGDQVAPLAYLLNNNRSLFAAECVKEIIAQVMGEDEANLLNGNGNARRFMPANHPPLYSRQKDMVGFFDLTPSPTMTNKMLLMPPYLRDAAAWIEEVARYDAAGKELTVFFYGYADKHTQTSTSETWPVPIYGLLSEVLHGRNRWEIGDTVQALLVPNAVLNNAGAQSRPDKDYNRVLVVNSPEGVDKSAMLGPGLHVGIERVPANDPRAPEKTWERTLVEEMGYFWMNEWDVLRIAQMFIKYSAGADAIFAELEIGQGEALMHWGDLVKPHMTMVHGSPEDAISDDSLGLSGSWFRVIRVRHFGNQRDREFKTSLMGHTLSNFDESVVESS